MPRKILNNARIIRLPGYNLSILLDTYLLLRYTISKYIIHVISLNLHVICESELKPTKR